MTQFDWSAVLSDNSAEQSKNFNWGDVLGEASKPHPPIYDAQNRPIDQTQLYQQHRQEPYPGMPLEQAWASDPISQGLATTLENPDVRTGLLALGAQPELMALPEAAAGIEAAGNAPKAVAAAAKLAPTEAERTAAIKSRAGAGIQAAKDSGVAVPASEAQGLLNQIKTDTESEHNPLTHTGMNGFFYKFEKMLPKADEEKAALSAQMSRMAPVPRAALEKKLAELGPKEQAVVTVKQLHNVRQSLGEAQKHAYRNGFDQESMAATKAKESIDNFLVDKMGQKQWSQDMKDYARASTAEDIQNLVDRALYRTSQLSANQKAARLYTEIRNWARPTYKGPNARMRMLRGVSPEAADKMEALAKAQIPNSNLLKMLGTAAPTGIMPVALDEVAGHLFTSILGIHVNPLLLMAGGVTARHIAGHRVEAGINDIVRVLNDSSLGPRVESLQKTVGGPSIFSKLMARPRTAQAIKRWANAKGPDRRFATIALTTAIAKEANRPDLQQRIQNEIQNIDGETIVPKTQQAMR